MKVSKKLLEAVEKALDEENYELAIKIMLYGTFDPKLEIMTVYACAKAAALVEDGMGLYPEVIAHRAVVAAIEKTNIELTRRQINQLVDAVQKSIEEHWEKEMTPYGLSMLPKNFNLEHEIIKLQLIFEKGNGMVSRKFVREKITRLAKRCALSMDMVKQRRFNKIVTDGVKIVDTEFGAKSMKDHFKFNPNYAQRALDRLEKVKKPEEKSK
jgi:hypothetical protein